MGDPTHSEPGACARRRLPTSILAEADFAALAGASERGWTAARLEATFDGSPEVYIRACCAEAEVAVRRGVRILVISDRNAAPGGRVPAPTLLVCGAVHQHLVRHGLRLRAALLVDAGDVREVHDACTLLGFGADALSPRVALEVMRRVPGASFDRYRAA